MKLHLWSSIFWCFSFHFFATIASAQEGVSVYGKYETQFKIGLNGENPFFSNEIQVDALIKHEDGTQWIVPCFYDATRDWKLRFAPMKAGTYTYDIIAKKQSGETRIQSGAFTAAEKDSPGFVRVSQRNPRFFAFDNGESYFPVGQNLCWVNPATTATWKSYLQECDDAGINWIRIWMVSWGNTELVWSPNGNRYNGIGRYEINNARMLDDIFAEAEERGIYIQLVINHHGQYSSQTNPIWNENPYNTANGGFLNTPQEFFTDDTAKQHYRDRLRYLVARYGYSASLLAWEYWNEVDLTSGYNYETVYAWHREMSAFLEETDPYKHLRTTSAANNFGGKYLSDGMHYLQSHNYRTNIIGTTLETAKFTAERFPALPHIHGELSYDYRGPNTQDREGVILHNQLWASVHSSDAGTAMTWWWDNWVRPYNLYHEFKSITNYVEGIDWIGENLQPIEVSVKPVPDNVVDLNILPVKGWDSTSTHEFTVRRDGTVENISDLSSFVHGNFHRNMSPNPTFLITSDHPTSFGIEINTIARAGCNLTIKVNQNIVIDHDFASSNGDYTPQQNTFEVQLPAGANRVEVVNAGSDWFNTERYWITDFAERIRVYARGNVTKALVWVHDSTHQMASLEQYDPNKNIQPTEITIAGMKTGEYWLERFDTYSGQSEAPQILLVSDNRLIFPVLDLKKDTAFRISARTSQIKQSNKF